MQDQSFKSFTNHDVLAVDLSPEVQQRLEQCGMKITFLVSCSFLPSFLYKTKTAQFTPSEIQTKFTRCIIGSPHPSDPSWKLRAYEAIFSLSRCALVFCQVDHLDQSEFSLLSNFFYDSFGLSISPFSARSNFADQSDEFSLPYAIFDFSSSNNSCQKIGNKIGNKINEKINNKINQKIDDNNDKKIDNKLDNKIDNINDENKQKNTPVKEKCKASQNIEKFVDLVKNSEDHINRQISRLLDQASYKLAESTYSGSKQSAFGRLQKTSFEGRRAEVCVTGVSLGLPNKLSGKRFFDPENIERIFKGENFLENLSGEEIDRLITQKVAQLDKRDGLRQKVPLTKREDFFQIVSRLGNFDLHAEFGVPKFMLAGIDKTCQLAVAAGLEALSNAGISLGNGEKDSLLLPPEMRPDTGIIFASSFPQIESCVEAVSNFLVHRFRSLADSEILQIFFDKTDRQKSSNFLKSFKNGNESFKNVNESFKNVNESFKNNKNENITNSPNIDKNISNSVINDQNNTKNAQNSTKTVQNNTKTIQNNSKTAQKSEKITENEEYSFDRKLLFKLLVLANSQLAQILGAQGPNTHINAACASTSQALCIAGDWIKLGRCKRVLVVSADNATSENLLPYIGSGFLALGASCTKQKITEAAVPFDKRRSGMILGMAAVGFLLESASSCADRRTPLATIELTQFSNSALHASLLHKAHIASELERFVRAAEKRLRIRRDALARSLIYYSHETGTAKGGGCALAELNALRSVFGKSFSQICICAVKGFLGHPMGANVEDVMAVASLSRGLVPPVPNYSQPDEALGELQLSVGGAHQRQFALRLAAGFGSQLVFILYGRFFVEKCALI